MSGETEDTWEPLSHWMNSQLIKQTQERGQTVITRSIQWVCHALNKSSSICVSSTSIFRPQNYLAYACCMKPGCSEMIQSVSPHIAARNTSLLHHSILTTYYHTDTMLTSSLEVLHTLWCTLVCSLVPRPPRAERVWWHPADSLGFIKNS